MEKEREQERDREKGKEGGKEERKHPRLEVYLPDAVPKAFEMVLSYIYTDRIYPAGINGTYFGYCSTSALRSLHSAATSHLNLKHLVTNDVDDYSVQ